MALSAGATEMTLPCLAIASLTAGSLNAASTAACTRCTSAAGSPFGPKGLPAAEVQRVHAAVEAAFNDPAVKEAMAKQGNVISVAPADKAMPFFRSEMARYAKLVKKAGVELQW